MKKRLFSLIFLLFVFVVFSCGNSDDDDDDVSDDDDDDDDDDMFTDRDLEQTPDLSGAEYITLSSGENVAITDEGVYVISGNVTNTTV